MNPLARRLAKLEARRPLVPPLPTPPLELSPAFIYDVVRILYEVGALPQVLAAHCASLTVADVAACVQEPGALC